MRPGVWERWAFVVRLALVSLVLGACQSSSRGPESAREVGEAEVFDEALARESGEPTPGESVGPDPGESVEAGEAERQKHIVYLHGRIVAEQGPHAVSEEYGPYEFYEIVDKLGLYYAIVHAPLRDSSEQLEQSVSATVALVRKLLAEGVEPAEVTIVGASQGALIAMKASEELQTPGLRFVLMGACNDWVRDEVAPRLVGDVLSIYEEGDKYGGSCQDIIAASPGVDYTAEVRLETDLGHGFLYRPLPEWVDPVRDWAKGMVGGSSRAQRELASAYRECMRACEESHCGDRIGGGCFHICGGVHGPPKTVSVLQANAEHLSSNPCPWVRVHEGPPGTAVKFMGPIEGLYSPDRPWRSTLVGRAAERGANAVGYLSCESASATASDDSAAPLVNCTGTAYVERGRPTFEAQTQ